MTVADVKALVPLADVYEFKPGARYLVVLPHAEENAARHLGESLILPDGARGFVLMVSDPHDVRLFDLEALPATP